MEELGVRTGLRELVLSIETTNYALCASYVTVPQYGSFSWDPGIYRDSEEMFGAPSPDSAGFVLRRHGRLSAPLNVESLRAVSRAGVTYPAY